MGIKIETIVSGGQTGVDRAALDFALDNAISVKGWCPKGRLAEDGAIHSKYPLKETETDQYEERSVRNVAESDGLLLFSPGRPLGGTAFTMDAAFELNKPFFLQDPNFPLNIKDIQNWIIQHKIKTLNIAGPRESEVPGIYNTTIRLLKELLAD